MSQFTASINHLRMTIEHQLILTADQIDINNRNAAFRNALTQHFQPQLAFASMKRRGIEIQQQLRTRMSGFLHRIGLPYVFTNRDADSHALYRNHGWFCTSNEVALLVKHAVIGQ